MRRHVKSRLVLGGRKQGARDATRRVGQRLSECVSEVSQPAAGSHREMPGRLMRAIARGV